MTTQLATAPMCDDSWCCQGTERATAAPSHASAATTATTNFAPTGTYSRRRSRRRSRRLAGLGVSAKDGSRRRGGSAPGVAVAGAAGFWTARASVARASDGTRRRSAAEGATVLPVPDSEADTASYRRAGPVA